MNKIPLVSIIVPVYNTPKEWINECVESVIRQNYSNIELIIVDDGSNSLIAKFCDKFESIPYFPVKVCHQENGGLSAARNAGMSYAQGEYIFFLDSDDELENQDSIEELVNRASSDDDIDAVIGSTHIEYSKKKIGEGVYDGKSLLSIFLNDAGSSFTAQDILYSKRLLSTLDYLFVEGMVHEDEEFTPRALYCARKVFLLVNIKTYKRITRSQSITTANDELSVYKRCAGKLILAKSIIDNPLFEIRSINGKRNVLRAYAFANMAFRAWCESITSKGYEDNLFELANLISYSKCPILLDTIYNVRTYICIKTLSLIGLNNYIRILKVIFQ